MEFDSKPEAMEALTMINHYKMDNPGTLCRVLLFNDVALTVSRHQSRKLSEDKHF